MRLLTYRRPAAAAAAPRCTPPPAPRRSNLANKGLTGSLPSDAGVWAGLTGLSSIDLSGNSLGGGVPAAIKSAGPQLTSM